MGVLAGLFAKLRNARIRSEVGWLLAHKVAEFLVVFATLKVFTTAMPEAVFGEYQLALSALMLLTNFSAAPISQAFIRLYHESGRDGTRRSLFDAVRIANWRVALVTAIGAAVLSYPVSHLFGFEPLTLFATGLIILGNRWRSLWIYLLDIRRERRTGAIQNVGFFLGVLSATVVVISLVKMSATSALLTYAFVAAAFGWLGRSGFERERLASEPGRPSAFRQAAWEFGLPIGALLTFQWFQSFSERWILGIQLTLDEVGQYVAAYQVAGAPYLMLMAIVNGLVIPVAYQRAGGDASNLKSADRVLIAGTVAYLLFGAACLPLYAYWGHEIARLLTSKEYALPSAIILLIAAARYLNCLGLVLHSFFLLHRRTMPLLITSAVAAAISIPVYWYAVSAGAIRGAAIGVCTTASFYVCLMLFAPGGVIWLLRSPAGGSDPGGPQVIEEASMETL